MLDRNELLNQFNAKLTLGHDGMNDVIWEIGNEPYHFSNINNFLNDSLIELINACLDLANGRDGLMYWFHPGEISRITLKISEESAHILKGRVTTIKSKEQTTNNLEFIIPIQKFLEGIYSAIKQYAPTANERDSAIASSFPICAFEKFEVAILGWLVSLPVSNRCIH